MNRQDKFAYNLAGQLLLTLRLEPNSIVLTERDSTVTATGISRGKDPTLPSAGTFVTVTWDITKDDWRAATDEDLALLEKKI